MLQVQNLNCSELIRLQQGTINLLVACSVEVVYLNFAKLELL